MPWKLTRNMGRIELLVCKQNVKQPMEIDVSEINVLRIRFIEPIFTQEKVGEDNPVRIALEVIPNA